MIPVALLLTLPVPTEVGDLPERPHPRPVALPTLWEDIDGDGDLDLFASTTRGDRLFRNRGEGEFEEVACPWRDANHGPTRSVSVQDYDRDERADLLLVGGEGQLRLWRGLGDLAFEPVELPALESVVSAAWQDVDRDGWLDLAWSGPRGAGLLFNRGGLSFELGQLAALLPPQAEPREGAGSFGPGEAGAPAVSDADAEAEHGAPRGPRAPRTKARAAAGFLAQPVGTFEEGGPQPVCAEALLDVATLSCVMASSVGSLGTLYPLSVDFNVNARSSYVGMGTTSPQKRLHVFDGSMRVDGDLDVVDTSGNLVFQGDVQDSGGSRLRLFNENGFECAELSSGAGANQDGRLTLGGGSVFSEQVVVDGGRNDGGGELLLKNDVGATTVLLDGDLGGGGALSVYNDSGSLTFFGSAQGSSVSLREGNAIGVLLDGNNSDDGGLIRVYPDVGSFTVNIDGEAPGGGGMVQLFTQNAANLTAETLRITGDEGLDGKIELFDANGVPPEPTITLRGEDSIGTGSEILIKSSGSASTTTIDMDGANGNVGELRINETDGSIAFRMVGNTLGLFNAGGATTQSYDRQTGAKSAVVGTENFGRRKLYGVESPEVWLEDFGRGRLKGGVARIELDPIFLETVTIDAENPMRVYLTATSATAGLYVRKARRGFVVREVAGGSNDASFDWRVVAKRKGLEGARMEEWIEEEVDGVVRKERPEPVAEEGSR